MIKKTSLFWLVLLAATGMTHAQTDMKETMSVIKSSLAQSKANIRQYSWVETTQTWINGELKSTKENQCYYSVDGKLTKIATGNNEPAHTPRGIKGKIIAKKKEELSDYIDLCLKKIHTYLPPDSEKLQKTYDAGKVAIQILKPGEQFKLSFPDYLQQGDLLSISVDIAAKKLLGLSVTSWIDTPEDIIKFEVVYKNLPDGTQYASETTLNAQAKDLKIVIGESGFRKGNGQ